MKIKLSDYAEREAEEGSDNENHDHIVKKIIEEYEEETRDDDLEDLINNDKVKNKNTNKIIQKHKEDEIKEDKQKIQSLIEKGFKGRRRKYSELKQTEDKNSIKNRIKKSRKDEKEVNFKEQLLNMSKYKKTLLEYAEEENMEEVNDIISNYEKELKKKLTSESSDNKKKFIERLNENEKILENVVNLNDEKKVAVKNDVKYDYMKLNNQNSFLYAIKNDKYKVATKEITKVQVQGNVYSVFRNKTNSRIDSERKANISNIFKSENI
jgi:hypothetical protein